MKTGPKRIGFFLLKSQHPTFNSRPRISRFFPQPRVGQSCCGKGRLFKQPGSGGIRPPCPWKANEMRKPLFMVFSWTGRSDTAPPCNSTAAPLRQCCGGVSPQVVLDASRFPSVCGPPSASGSLSCSGVVGKMRCSSRTARFIAPAQREDDGLPMRRQRRKGCV